MKPANDPTIDYKALVRAGYDRSAHRYNEARLVEPPSGLHLLDKHLHTGARVLDIGCGAGIPLTRTLAERFSVTGVDFSTEQIRRARRNVPQAEFIESDVMAVKFPSDSFAAAVAFFVLFHLPRHEQQELLKCVHSWLAPGGLLLATLSVLNEPPYIEDEFFGSPMYWTNFSEHEYHDHLHSLGFETLSTTAVHDGISESHAGPGHRHPLVLVRKLGGLGDSQER